MASNHLLSLLALAFLAILLSALAPLPVDALSLDSHNLARNHNVIARKRSNQLNKRCKARPASAPSSTSTHTAAHTPTPTPTPTHSSTYNGGSSPGPRGGKVGLAWPNGDSRSLAHFVSDKVSYIYTWSPDGPAQAKSLNLSFLPMLWGDRQIGEFTRLVKPGYAHHVLGFNEPNEPGQSNMSPQHGAYLWKTYIQPLKSQGYSLISPATSSNPNGMTWMKAFFAACDGCTFDGIALHYYDVSSQGMIDYINKWRSAFNLPIWVTEYACQNFNGGPQCSQSQVNNFMATVTSFMNNADFVQGYFAFGIMTDMQGVNPDNQLMNNAGQPTNLGWQYLSGY